MITDPGRKLIEFPLNPGGIQVFDLNRTGHLLIHAWGSKHNMGAYFPDVVLCGFSLLGKIDGVSHLQTTGNRHHLLSDPCKRQVRGIIIRGQAWIHRHEVLSHAQHVIVGEQCPFGQRSGARGIEKERHFIAMALVDYLPEQLWLLLFKFPTQLLNLLEAYQIVLIIISHPFGIIPYDFFQPRAFIEDGNRFVYLFLAFTKQKSSV